MTRQDLTPPPDHHTRPDAIRHDAIRHGAIRHGSVRQSGPRPATLTALVVGAVVLLAVFGAYPLLDRADSPVVQAVTDVLDPGPRPSGSTGVGGGEIPGGTATLDDDLPGITNLDPALADAVRRAADDAAAAGIDFWITSGWRSPAFQQLLFDEAVRKLGSLEAAERAVATPERSAHVTGKAIDIGPTEADYWLIEHGTDYGLCQVYATEIWHFELLTEPGGTCPPMLEDAAAG